MQFLIVTPDQKQQIDAINAANMGDHKDITPISLNDGRYILSTDLLQDCGEGQTWSIYQDILISLSTEDIDSSAFITVTY